MLNTQQAEAAEKIKSWFYSHDKDVFFLSGYAGTGKTFLVHYLIKNILDLSPADVVFCAYTGKAVSVLLQKGNYEAVTIHKLIYKSLEKEKKNEDGTKTKSFSFVKRSEIPPYKLIILDEVSMVDKKIMDDLLSFGIPVLACGDKAQLPPVGGYQLDFLEKPDYLLTEIVRQSEDNAIVKIATKARNNEYIPVGNYGDVVVIRRENITDDYMKKILLGMDQILCGTNKTRQYLNNLVRSYHNLTEATPPTDGEKVICVANNWAETFGEDDRFSLVNGTIGYLEGFKLVSPSEDISKISVFRPDFIDDDIDAVYDILIDNHLLTTGERKFDLHQKIFVMDDGSYKPKYDIIRMKNESKESFMKRLKSNIMISRGAEREETLNFFEYAYAISCHKAQGSEWDKVVVFDESHIFGKEANRWLYTAITRAKKKLIIIK